ncbi:deoxyribonuclease-1 isoform X2 [Nematostella vectensis]|uniref:deoxyribonuclease-1 isoform X2 n=1 Tax=Nematostella vectensis TaxID=45351 RepID=UPI00207797FE|nr:deoxyribonuclease-1 isoform X2 [Nematostella vectensis]
MSFINAILLVFAFYLLVRPLEVEAYVKNILKNEIRAPLDRQDAGSGQVAHNLKIGAFNVQVFGVRKMEVPGVAEILVKILLRYDIVLIQEIRDSSQTAMPTLLQRLNKEGGRASAHTYDMTISARLGRTTSKEQYAFVYRSELFSVVRTYVYSDPKDLFEREPYIVHFRSFVTAIKDLVFAGIHTKPSQAAAEIDHLVDVYDDIRDRWGMDDVIIMGDFNGACDYVKDSERRVNRLFTDHRFSWLITDCVDTTTGGGACAYDRFVAAGASMMSAVVPGSAGRFAFDKVYGLSEAMTGDVSDHYPIELEIYSKAYVDAVAKVNEKTESKFFAITPLGFDPTNIYSLRHSDNPLVKNGFQRSTLYIKRAIAIVTNVKTVSSSHDAVQAFELVYKSWPSLVRRSQVELAKLKAAEKMGANDRATVKLVCRKVPAPAECWVALEM